VFGLTFAGAGIVVLAGGSLLDEGHVLLPAGLLGLGVALMVQNAARNRPAGPDAPAPAEPAAPAAPADRGGREPAASPGEIDETADRSPGDDRAGD
jgi:hypothetical protein